MIDPHIFETPPDSIAIAQSAWEEWQRFVGDRSENDALRQLIAIHVKHIHDIVLPVVKREKSNCGVFVTDIKGFELSLIDAHFPLLGERNVGIYLRSSVTPLLNQIRQSLDMTVAPSESPYLH